MFQVFVDSAVLLLRKNTISMSVSFVNLVNGKELVCFESPEEELSNKEYSMPCAPAVKSRPD